jgi:hypothetical protein
MKFLKCYDLLYVALNDEFRFLNFSYDNIIDNYVTHYGYSKTNHIEKVCRFCTNINKCSEFCCNCYKTGIEIYSSNNKDYYCCYSYNMFNILNIY